MADLVFSETIGWFDPAIAYCINGDKNPVVGERLLGILMDDGVEDGFFEQVELLCASCLTDPSQIT